MNPISPVAGWLRGIFFALGRGEADGGFGGNMYNMSDLVGDGGDFLDIMW